MWRRVRRFLRQARSLFPDSDLEVACVTRIASSCKIWEEDRAEKLESLLKHVEEAETDPRPGAGIN